MASTKIINVQKGDSYEDVFDVYKKTEAKEVIFIFPKGTRFAKNGGYLESIKDDAKVAGKSVSIMTSDPVIGRLAVNYGFDLLSKPSSSSNTKKPKDDEEKLEVHKIRARDDGWKPISGDDDDEKNDNEEKDKDDLEEDEYKEDREPVPEDEDDDYGSNIAPSSSHVEDEIQATLAAIKRPVKKIESRLSNYGRAIRDIVKNEPERNVEIDSNEDENDYEIGINRKTEKDRKKDSDIEEVWSRFGRGKEKKDEYKHRTKIGFPKKIFIYVIVGIIILAGLAAYLFLGHTTVTVYPVISDEDFQINVVASVNASAINLGQKIIPGQLFTATANDSGTFNASGQNSVVTKATGTITIYNTSLSAQRLVATTRFQTSDGVIFRIPATVTVPAATTSGIQNIPGSVVSDVYADRPGAEFNIAPSRFTIPGFASTPKSDQFYAISSTSMTGGMVGPSKIVTEEDFSKAQEQLDDSVRSKIITSLKNQSGDLKILENTFVTLNPPTTNAKANDPAADLEMSVSGNAQTIGFREDDIVSLVKDYLSKNGNFDYLPGKMDFSYLSPTMNVTAKTLSFTVRVSGKAIYKIDSGKIVNDIAGMNTTAVRDYFDAIKGIQTVNISMFPRWATRISSDPSKIILKIIGY